MALERRIVGGPFEKALGHPGLVQLEDGTFELILPDGTRTTIGGVVPLAFGSGPPAPASNEEWSLVGEASFPYVGSFRLTFRGDATPDIDVNATNLNDVIAMLEALPSIGAGNVEFLAGGGGDPTSFVDNGGELDFVFVGDLAGQEVEHPTITSLSMTANGNPTTADDFSWDGSAGNPELPPNSTHVAIYVDVDTATVYTNTAVGAAAVWLPLPTTAYVDGEFASIPQPPFAISDVAGLQVELDAKATPNLNFAVVAFDGPASYETGGFVVDATSNFSSVSAVAITKEGGVNAHDLHVAVNQPESGKFTVKPYGQFDLNSWTEIGAGENLSSYHWRALVVGFPN